MAVEIKYVVVRNGEEKMTFVSKKEADAYDKMLDLADELTQLLAGAPIALDESQQEGLALFLAQQREQLSLILKGGKLAAETEATEGEPGPKRRRSKHDEGEATSE